MKIYFNFIATLITAFFVFSLNSSDSTPASSESKDKKILIFENKRQDKPLTIHHKIGEKFWSLAPGAIKVVEYEPGIQFLITSERRGNYRYVHFDRQQELEPNKKYIIFEVNGAPRSKVEDISPTELLTAASSEVKESKEAKEEKKEEPKK